MKIKPTLLIKKICTNLNVAGVEPASLWKPRKRSGQLYHTF